MEEPRPPDDVVEDDAAPIGSPEFFEKPEVVAFLRSMASPS